MPLGKSYEICATWKSFWDVRLNGIKWEAIFCVIRTINPSPYVHILERKAKKPFRYVNYRFFSFKIYVAILNACITF